MEDNIDIRKYIEVLIRRWKVIVGITVIALIIATLVTFLQPQVYQAKSALLITRVKSQLVLEPSYVTSSQLDSTSQRQALIALVNSSSVATLVGDKLKDKLTPTELIASNLLGGIQASNQGDFIEITASFSNAEESVAIVNTWAIEYQNYINSLYSEVSQSPQELQEKADAAKLDYQEKQKAYENFIGNNKNNEIKSQINDKEVVRDLLLLRDQLGAETSSTSASTANRFVFILLKIKTLTSLPGGTQIPDTPVETLTSSLPWQYQLAIDPTGLNISQEEVDALISNIETRWGGERESIETIKTELLQLYADLEREQARQIELKNARDVSLSAYKAINNKIAEVKASLNQNAIVKVVELATASESTSSRRPINIGIAFVLGLVVGIFAAFSLEYYDNNLKRNKTKSKTS